MEIKSADVAIIGAGVAACHLAQNLVSQGIKTLLIDQHPLDNAGPDWINGVPAWMFDKAGLTRPQGQELFDQNGRFIIRAPDLHTKISVDSSGLYDVHMKHLRHRLKESFLAHPKFAKVAEAFIVGCHMKGDRLKALICETSRNRTLKIEAPLFVDASGLKAVVRKNHPWANAHWPNVERQDICLAIQASFFIKDRHGAMSFLEENHINPGETLSDVGFMGGYSLLRKQIDRELNHISLLCGVLALPQYDSAHTIVNQFVKKHPWIGDAFIEGRGAIPLNSPYHKLAAPGLALLGDTACQVYAAHGSGIGIGLVAAKMLADTIVDARTKNRDVGSSNVLENYTRKFHKKYYERLYFSEHFRRFSESLNPADIIELMNSGLMNEHMIRQTLMQANLHLPIASAPSFMKAAARSPRLFACLIPIFKKALHGKINAIALSRGSLWKISFT